MSEPCDGCHADATHFLCDECLDNEGVDKSMREREEARAEVERLREALRDVAERQREACARATEETWPENPVRAARIRATPLVTEEKP